MCASLHHVVYTYCFVDSAAFYLFDIFAELYTFPHWFCNFCSLSCLNARIYHCLIDTFVFIYIARYDKCHCIKQTVCEMYSLLIPTLGSNNYPSRILHVLTYHWVMTHLILIEGLFYLGQTVQTLPPDPFGLWHKWDWCWLVIVHCTGHQWCWLVIVHCIGHQWCLKKLNKKQLCKQPLWTTKKRKEKLRAGQLIW